MEISNKFRFVEHLAGVLLGVLSMVWYTFKRSYTERKQGILYALFSFSYVKGRVEPKSEKKERNQARSNGSVTTADGTTMKMLVDRIQISNEGIVVEFKCGVAIEQEYVK